MTAPPRRSLWAPRRWLVAGAVAVAYVGVVGVPTDLIDTPLFWREIPPTWWSWPSLLLTALLVGLLASTYVAVPHGLATRDEDRPRRGGTAGAALTFFAVGCPVCNKLVLLALGSSGAMTYFEPAQPFLQAAAIALLGWALRARLRGERACPMPTDPPTPKGILHA
jgi:hypothetical protein